VNFVEFFIHHEDVLRGDGQVGPRREVPLREQKALWKTLKRLGTVFFRRSPVGVVLERTDGKTLTVRGETDLGTVTLRGEATELVRHAVRIPLIASGGAGRVEHFAPAVRAGADAVLAASVFHFGELTIGEVKEALRQDGIPVR
jgi:hypothetical protein